MSYKSVIFNIAYMILLFSLLIGGSNIAQGIVGQNSENLPDLKMNLQSGLLLGLATEKEVGEKYNGMFARKPDELRTLWIYSDGKRIVKKEKNGSVYSPVGDTFYEIRNDLFEYKIEMVDTENIQPISDEFNCWYRYSDIVSNTLGSPHTALYTEENYKNKFHTDEDGSWPFQSYIEWPWYIGNKYMCIMSSYAETGGGSYSSEGYNYKLVKIADLSDIDKRDRLETLFSLLDKNTQNNLNSYAKEYSKIVKATDDGNDLTKEGTALDMTSLSLTRKNGKWVILIPVFSTYYHSGNGSSYFTPKEYIPYECSLPKEITSYDTLCMDWKTVKGKIPAATDAMSSPKSDLLVVFTDKEMLVFAGPVFNFAKPNLRVPMNKHEKVISNQWTTGKYVQKWNDILSGYIK